jgi:CBS domain-containing protein
VPTADPALDVRSAARLLVQSGCGVLPVVVDDDSMPVAAAMTPAVSTCRASDSLGVGLRQLRRSGDDAVLVLDDQGHLVGLLSFPDLIRVAARGGR